MLRALCHWEVKVFSLLAGVNIYFPGLQRTNDLVKVLCKAPFQSFLRSLPQLSWTLLFTNQKFVSHSESRSFSAADQRPEQSASLIFTQPHTEALYPHVRDLGMHCWWLLQMLYPKFLAVTTRTLGQAGGLRRASGFGQEAGQSQLSHHWQGSCLGNNQSGIWHVSLQLSTEGMTSWSPMVI